jgi:two-component system, OmpR family, sensor kinase
VILAGFAAIVGVLTDRQVVGQFNDNVSAEADSLQNSLNRKLQFVKLTLDCDTAPVHLNDYASVEHAQIRVFADNELACTQNSVIRKGAKAPYYPSLFSTPPQTDARLFTQSGYRVALRSLDIKGPVHYDGVLLYARPLSDLDHTIARVRFFLILGVFGGTILALLAGLATAQRAMRPVVQLSDAAREIERTRDPSQRLPHPEAEDEVAELARTLEGMLAALGASRAETEAMLDRQREFVADASHELRTPLTSVLANLELLTEELAGEQAETAEAALRSTRRMRRLVGDLLLLARADAKRVQPRRRTDLGAVLTEAASELGPMADEHEVSIDPAPAAVEGAQDELHRLTLNLLENAVRHTPPGTHVNATTASLDGWATLVVEDDGPGIPEQLEQRMFERFVRGGGDGGRGSGLGLAIVRAVAEAHGGSVEHERPEHGGTRFVVRIPRVPDPAVPDAPDLADPLAQTSTTTGSTIGRRRSRS